jgi:integrase
MKRLQGGALRSVGTVRNYELRLKLVTQWIQQNRLGSLRELTPERALEYLQQRASQVGQKTLDMDRQAIQAMMRHVTGQLGEKETLPVIKSIAQERPHAARAKPGQPNNLGRRLSEQSRLYTHRQIELIAARQAPHNALATEIAAAAGLRAHELLTLHRLHKQPSDERPAHALKFAGVRETTLAFSVVGKGGLVREVRIPIPLAKRLIAARLEEPRVVWDRGVRYEQNYAIGGGQAWSQSFSEASKAALGWSSGAHSLRHGYAQQRLERVSRDLTRVEALRVVSQEMGHFRPEITEVYLR